MIKHTNQVPKTQVKVFHCLRLFNDLETKWEYYPKRKVEAANIQQSYI